MGMEGNPIPRDENSVLKFRIILHNQYKHIVADPVVNQSNLLLNDLIYEHENFRPKLASISC